MSFSKTDFVDNSLPAISAAELNKLGQGIEDLFALLEGPKTAYTPSLGTWTLGNGTIAGAYKLVGNHLKFRIIFTVGSTTTTTANTPTFSLPAGFEAITEQRQSVAATLRDASVPDSYAGWAVVDAGSTVVNRIKTLDANDFVTSTVPHTWAAGDTIEINGEIEVQTP